MMENRKVIGMIIPTTDNSFFSALAHYIESHLAGYGYRILLCDSNNNSENEREYLKLLAPLCSGIIDVSGLSELGDGLLPDDYPIVFVDRKPFSSRVIPWVGNDDESAMYEATSYLLEKGCRNILLLPGLLAEKRESPRVSGYKKALSDRNNQVNESLIIYREGKKSSQEETRDIVMDVLSQNKKIDAIITSSDRSAFSVMKAIGLLGYYAPEDIKLISFDNTPYSTLASPSITAIDRNPERIADKAVETMLKLLSKEEVSSDNIIQVSLVERDSTR
ncbi:MAG: substrate-binding domain-containing protein [Erysipelotrichaceae bacterium]|nr:substrate-binding domain-containing protein [Erysipelotrichaceae bacterium]